MRAIWTSSALGVATVGASGLASSAETGTTMIEAAVDSFKTTTTLTVLTPDFVPTGDLNTARGSHTATLVDDGTVLVTGGCNPPDCPLDSAELYAPATGTFTPTANMTTSRRLHTATLLKNGMVLVAGGSPPLAPSLVSLPDTPELYNPQTRTFAATGTMTTSRISHTATLLNDGTVLVAGGNPRILELGPLASAELYNPATGTFSPTAVMTAKRAFHTATLLKNGMVLLTGGSLPPGSNGPGNDSGALDSAELYAPATGVFTATGRMTGGRVSHTATLLNNGMVLIAGGCVSGCLAASAELYNPATGAFTATGNMTIAREAHTATLLNNGMVLITGGSASVATAELYDPATGTFSAAGAMATSRFGHTATLLNSGIALVVGGFSGSSVLTLAELWR